MKLALLALMLLFAVSACGGNSAQVYRVEYQISGTARTVGLHYENESGSSEEINETRPPWNLQFEARSGQLLYVAVLNRTDAGTVSCRLLINGVEVKSATSEGAYVRASCGGRL